jgi:outer membrane protein, multidrug efflux system
MFSRRDVSNKFYSWPVVAAGLLSFTTGCIPALQVREANKQTPAHYPGVTAAPAGTGSEPTTEAQEAWGEFFKSPELRELITLALTNNQELNIRIQEILVAQAEVGEKQSEYMPHLGVGVGVGLDKVGRYTSQGAADDLTKIPTNPLGDFKFGLFGSWEVDAFGKLRNAKKAADARYLSSIEARNFVVTQIVAEVAREYYDLLSLDNSLEILYKNIDLQQQTLEIVKLQKQAARVTELAVQRFEAELFKYKSRVFEIEQERIQTENRINFLVGRYPQPVTRNPNELLDALPTMLSSGLPSQLLDNRPDVRAAQLELEATKLDVKATKAAFYPSLSIDAGVGYQSFNLDHIITTPASLFYNAAVGLVAPLVNRNAIEAHYRSANAKQLQAVFDFERTLLQAFTDVANQMAAINNLQQMHDFLTLEVETLQRAVDISTTLFQAARAEYIEVLTTRRDYLEAEMDLVDAKKRRFQALVGVYQALGGGWQQPGA